MLIFLAAIESEEDRSKLELIYEEYAGFMFRKAFSILNNRQDAEDAVHNAFLKIIDHLDRLPDSHSVQTKWYVVTAAENAAIDLYRKRKRSQETAFEEALSSENYTEPYKGENGLTKIILKLSGRDRDVLLLRYIYGYRHAEIGILLGMTEDAAKKAVKRAEERLEKECREAEFL